MKKILFIGIIALFVGFLFFNNRNTSDESLKPSVSPTPNVSESTRGIEAFTNGQANTIQFISEYDDSIWGGIVQEFKDNNGSNYRVDKATNHVVFFLTEDGKGRIGSNTTLVSNSQAEQVGLAFAKKKHD